jgi:hypothetical protein
MIRNDASRREKLVLGRSGVSVRLRRVSVVTTSRSTGSGRKGPERRRVVSGQSGGGKERKYRTSI